MLITCNEIAQYICFLNFHYRYALFSLSMLCRIRIRSAHHSNKLDLVRVKKRAGALNPDFSICTVALNLSIKYLWMASGSAPR